MLSTAVPQSFGFLTNQPSKISIGRVGSLDSVRQAVTLVGGDVDVTSDGVISTNEDGFLVFPSLNIAAVASSGTVPLGLLNQNGPVDLFNNANAQANILDAPLQPELSAFSALGKVTLTGPAPQTTSATRGRIFTSLVIVSGSTTANNFLFPYGFDRIEARNDLSINQSAFFVFQNGGSQARLAADFVSLTDDQVGFVGRFDIAARQQLRIDRTPFSGNDGVISDLRFASDGDLFVSDSSFRTSTSDLIEGISFKGRNIRLTNTAVNFRDDGEITLIASENLELVAGTSINATQADSITLNGRSILIADSTVDLTNSEPRGFNTGEPLSLTIGDCTLAGCTSTDSVTLRNAQITTASIGQRFVFTNNLARSAPINISAKDVSVESSTIAASTNARDVTCTNGACALADDERVADAGAITINAAARFTMMGDLSRITGSTTGRGDAGPVNISAATIDISGGIIESRNSMVAENAGKPLGAAGAVTLSADRISLGTATISTDTVTDNPSALPASISITSRRADLTLDGTQVSATTSSAAAAGSVALNSSGPISLQDGATVATTTSSNGAAGNITLTANGNVAVQSGATIRSESTAMTADAGRAGTINVTGTAITVDRGKVLASIDGGSASTTTADVVLTASNGNIDLRNQAQITVDTSAGSAGGNISFMTPADVSLAGTGTNVSSSSTGGGSAGGIQLGTATQRLGGIRVTSGAAVQANTSGTGNGGAINVFAGNAILTGSGSTLASNATDAGDGGTINIDATDVRLANGARIQSTAMGSGDSGAITLNVARDLRLTDSTPESFATQTAILTSAQQSSGGNITATVGGNLLLASSRIESSVATAAGKGGDINLFTQGLLLSSSQIFARADQGNGGGITVTRRSDLAPGPFLIDANSAISAQSRTAVSGVIAVDSTDTNVTTVIDPLGAALAQTPTLAANPCSARQSGAPSTFVRDTDGGVSPLPDNYFTAGVLAASSASPMAATSSETISLDTLMGATYGCAR